MFVQNQSMALLLCLLILGSASQSASSDDRQSREAVEALEAYAVYKMADYEEAFQRFMALAEKDNNQGMLNVANMLQAGLGTKQDEQAALLWYRRAADNGSAIGMFYTGMAYLNGQGTASNRTLAKQWLRSSAEAGSTEAQFKLGRLWLEDGQRDKAIIWIQQAADSGDAAARGYLNKLLNSPDQVIEIDPAIELAIESAWASIDRSMTNRNVPGVIHFIDHRARIRVRLPGKLDWLDLDRRQYAELWRETFTSSDDYSVQRGAVVHSLQGELVLVESTIDETLVKNEQPESLRLQESALVSVLDGAVRIEQLSLEITRR